LIGFVGLFSYYHSVSLEIPYDFVDSLHLSVFSLFCFKSHLLLKRTSPVKN
jgi:hypothetical protein